MEDPVPETAILRASLPGPEGRRGGFMGSQTDWRLPGIGAHQSQRAKMQQQKLQGQEKPLGLEGWNGRTRAPYPGQGRMTRGEGRFPFDLLLLTRL